MPQVFRLQHFRGGEQLRGAKAELGILAAALGPLARPLAHQPRANANQRLDAELFRERDDLPQLLQLFHDHDDLLAELRPSMAILIKTASL